MVTVMAVVAMVSVVGGLDVGWLLVHRLNVNNWLNENLLMVMVVMLAVVYDLASISNRPNPANKERSQYYLEQPVHKAFANMVFSHAGVNHSTQAWDEDVEN